MLKDIHDKLEEIPEAYQSLYTERNGKWELTGIQGVKTSADVERLQVGLTKERSDHKITKDKLGTWGEMVHDDVMKKLDRYDELEAASGGNLDDEKIEEIVEKRIGSKIAPYERKVADLEKQNGLLSGENDGYKTSANKRRIDDAVRVAMREYKGGKFIDTATDDILMNARNMLEITEDGAIITRDKVDITPGMDVGGWLTDMTAKRPHWQPDSGGGGGNGDLGRGNVGDNPFTLDNWNKTKQAAYYKEHGEEKTQKLAKMAGTKINGPKPEKK